MSRIRCLEVCVCVCILCVCVLKQSIDHHGKGASLILLFFSYLRTCWTSAMIRQYIYTYLHVRIYEKLRVYWTSIYFFFYIQILCEYIAITRERIYEMLMQLKIRWEWMIGIYGATVMLLLWACEVWQVDLKYIHRYDRLWHLRNGHLRLPFYGRINSQTKIGRTENIHWGIFNLFVGDMQILTFISFNHYTTC